MNVEPKADESGLLDEEAIEAAERDFVSNCSSSDMIALGRGHEVMLPFMLKKQRDLTARRIFENVEKNHPGIGYFAWWRDLKSKYGVRE